MPQPLVSITNLTSYWRAVADPNDGLIPQGTASYFDFKVAGDPYLAAQGWWDGWCLNPDVNIGGNNESYSAIVYSSYELSLLPPGFVVAPQHLDEVNWLLNQNLPGGSYNYGEVQAAIWKLMGYGTITTGIDITGDGSVSAADVDSLYDAAIANPNFVPDETQYIGVIFDPFRGSTHYQPIIGKVKAAALGDYVWEDLNANGLQDDGDTGINGVTVKLVRDLNQDGDFLDANEVLATATTGDNPDTAAIETGYYNFKGLTPGFEYQVVFDTPAGYVVSPRQSDGNAASNLNSDGLVSDKVYLSPGEFNRTIDAGLYRKAQLGDRVWVDANGNGQQDGGEADVAGVTVNLLDSNGNTIATQQTNGTGNYLFTNLNPGTYSVQFVAPGGYVLTTRDSGPDATDSDADTVTGKTGQYTLASGESNLTVDAGLVQKAHLGDFVWEDKNANGVQDGGETGIGGVTVNLKDANGNVVQTTTTNGAGGYGFDVLPGTYSVQVVAPATYFVSPKDVGNDATDSDIDAGTGMTGNYTLNSGDNNLTIDAGLYRKAQLGDRVWVDANGNGQQDGGEADVAGVTVNLLDSNGNTIATQQTNGTGNYLFTNLNPGTYSVQFVAPGGYVLTTRDSGPDATDSDADTVTGKTGQYTLASGESNLTVDAGLVQKAHLGDFVWEDKNANGVQDGGETGIGGVTVNLKDANGNVVQTTTTNGAGGYGFDVLPGTYSVQVVAPATYFVSPKDVGNDATDSDIDAGTGMTGNYTLNSGDNNLTIDAGLYRKAQLGDRVWVDANGNGQQDGGEADVAGVTVNLLDSNGNTIATQQTNGTGNYLFTNLNPGTYSVQFVAPGGYVLTTRDSGPDATDSDADTVTGKTGQYTLASGESNLTVDAGLVQKAHLGDFVWEDKNANGVQDGGETGIGGVTVNLKDANGNVVQTTTTNGAGGYGFDVLPGTYSVQVVAPATYFVSPKDVGNDATDSDIDAGTGMTGNYTLNSGDNNLTIDAGLYRKAQLGDRVWVDANGNGQQDGGEADVAGVTVNLLDSNGNTIATQQTNGTGNYLFTNLNPGTYSVQFVAPGGYVLTTRDSGPDATDSDADTVTGKTGQYTLASGESNLTVDAGLVQKAHLGDFVWEDKNANGVQDGGETGIGGVTVNLKDANGNVVQTTTTNGAGGYGFDVLPGTYSVQVVAPATYFVSPKDVGNDATDSDIDAGTGMTGNYTLNSGDNNLTIDAGLYRKAQLGDRVWVDANGNGQQDGGEADVAGVTVNLLDSNGNTIATQQTNGTGNYLFTNLNPGTYSVQFVAPGGYVLTTRDSGPDATDSDADTVTGKTGQYTLASGESNLTVDAGLIRVTPGIDIEKTTTGPSNANPTAPDYDNEDAANGVGVPILTPGSAVSWTYKVTNTGNTTFAKADVAIVDDSGTPLNGADDLSVANGKITYLSGDVGNDNLLSPGEVWLYKATGIVQNLTTLSAASTFDFNGSSATDGADGNIRTFTAGSISVHASAFSRDKASGDWAQAWLGSYGGGLGVTDSGEGSGGNNTHTVDNTGGRDNYVLFEFDKNVVVDSAFLGYVVNDSDMQVWIGTRSDAFNNHDALLSDADLAALGFTELNLTTLTTTRLADLNAGNVSGNVLVIAADTTDTTPEDMFKIQKLTVEQPQSGVYENKATVTAPGAPGDFDLSHYKNPVVVATPKIDIEKTTTGPSNANPTAPDYDNEDAANGVGVPILTPGSAVSWTYKVTNTGNTTFAKADVAIVDDSGTPLNGADDLSVANGKITYLSGDVGNDNLLSPGEVWLYKATGIVQNLTTLSAASTFDFNGSSATDGADGNIRTFTAGSISVHASAFSRDKASGDWAQAWLGSYGGGLGVTDSGEGSGGNNTHTVDNTGGRDNYVLFEFDKNVVVDSAFLGYVVNDSDMQVWIGTRSDAFNNHDALLSDADLAALGFTELNLTTLTTTRLADLNAGNVSGNVLVIAADTTDTTPEDMFKIQKLTVEQPQSGIYENKATVTAPGAPGDSDLSHYKNPAPVVPAQIGDFVWEDKNANGIQDAGEAGIANVTVKLLNSVGTVLATTTTNANGQYLFSNLNPGDYKVQVVAPNGYSITGKDLGGNDAKDSDIDATGTTVVTTLSAGENDLSWDAGLYRKASVGDKVWEDWNHNNVQDVGEGGIGNITVKLMDGSGTSVLATTKTDVNGNYLFSNLDPGNYVLQFDKTNVTFNNSHWGGSYNMSNWKWAVKDAGNNDAIDSDVAGDAIATTNVSKTDAFTLVSGQNDMTRDAGITPIVIDLDGNGIQTISRANSAGTFDLFGSGSAVASGWISGGDGFLAVDKNGNGKIDDISELFGGTTKGAGFAQLASYDSNGDGVVNAADSAFSEMSIWRDTNGNHQTDAGELMTLAQAGVSELRVGYTELAFLDQQGNVHLERSHATMSDGKSVDMTDVYFNVSADDAAAAGVELPGIAELLKGTPALSASDAGLVDLSVWRNAKAVPPTDSGSTGAITNAGVVGLNVDSLGDLFAAVGGHLQPEGIVSSASYGHDGMDLNDGCFNTAANEASIAGHLPVTDPGWLFA